MTNRFITSRPILWSIYVYFFISQLLWLTWVECKGNSSLKFGKHTSLQLSCSGVLSMVHKFSMIFGQSLKYCILKIFLKCHIYHSVLSDFNLQFNLIRTGRAFQFLFYLTYVTLRWKVLKELLLKEISPIRKLP